MKTTQAILVAVGGASCSGKSTLTNWLSKLLNCSIIHQDQFYKPDSEIPTVDGEANWDCPEAIDFLSFQKHLLSAKNGALNETHIGPNRPNLMMDDILSRKNEIDTLLLELKSVLNGNSLYLVDGFLLYTDDTIINQFDIDIFLTAPFEILKNRRESRTGYVTIEGSWVDPPNYFSNVVYPNYLKYNNKILDKLNDPQSDKSKIIVIDSSSHSIADVVVKSLKQMISILSKH
ncbi:P-loop containing nucleoside triphosphate hydrolase protein [Globomyces pollinis-pini]|nr:P-loop containing nucleoside triphosphate hydrolase protein [Globomyces pollinis-pini]